MTTITPKQVTAAKAFVRALDTGRFCFERRPSKPNKLYAGMLALLGGKSEQGETPEQTVRREVLEESKLSIDKFVFLENVASTVNYSDERGTKQVLTAIFFCSVPREAEAEVSDESEALEWLTLGQVAAHNPAPGLLDLIATHKTTLEK